MNKIVVQILMKLRIMSVAKCTNQLHASRVRISPETVATCTVVLVIYPVRHLLYT